MIEVATLQLIDLAAAVRPDWDRDRLAGAIGAVRSAGWPWPRILQETVRLMVDEQAGPRDLTEASRNPLHARRPAQPDPRQAEASRRGIAAVRAAMGGDQ